MGPMAKPVLFTLSQLMFAHLLKDAFQLSVHVRALVGEPEQHPDEPTVLTESIPRPERRHEKLEEGREAVVRIKEGEEQSRIRRGEKHAAKSDGREGGREGGMSVM